MTKAIFLFLVFLSPRPAAVVHGHDFKEKLEINSTPLLLNGVGLRTATIFNVKVYAAALYLPQKTQDEAQALSQRFPKQIQLHFLRAVSSDKIRDAWDDVFKKNCQEQDCKALMEPMDQLKAKIQNMEKGDNLTYTLTSTGVELKRNDQSLGIIHHQKFPTFLLQTWLGKYPPTEELKNGLLGRS